MINIRSEELRRFFSRPALLVSGVAVVVAFLVTYGYGLLREMEGWTHDPDYNHGFIVPVFSAYLLWHRRSKLASVAGGGSWWALPFFAAWALVRLSAAYFSYQTLDEESMVLFLMGLALLIGGQKAFVWAWPSIVFLLFMMPLPSWLSVQLSLPLQQFATRVTVFILQTLGVPSTALGNIIILSEGQRLEVAQACSGLRMLTLFFTICVGAAVVIHGSRWEKLVIVASAIPIAIVCNIARITLTALQREFLAAEWLDELAHAAAGWLMMPLAMVLLWGELALIWRVFPNEDKAGAFVPECLSHLTRIARPAGPRRL